jgi:hypothetical protein
LVQWSSHGRQNTKIAGPVAEYEDRGAEFGQIVVKKFYLGCNAPVRLVFYDTSTEVTTEVKFPWLNEHFTDKKNHRLKEHFKKSSTQRTFDRQKVAFLPTKFSLLKDAFS